LVDKENGVGFRKTENLVEDKIIAFNQERLNESQNQRFGDGKIVASIPLNVFYRDFPKYLQDGDSDFVKWWLNNEQNRPFRSFRGKL